MENTPTPPGSADPTAVAPPNAKGWPLYKLPNTEAAPRVIAERFEVGPLLGTGGMAWVYECKDRALRCRAAVKVLKDRSADARRRFLDEACILANLHHPHLVQVLGVGEPDDGAPFMALEILPGRSLEDRLMSEGPLPWREIVELATQAASALEALHRAGVIHRDVKPSNLVQIRGRTDRPLVKLIDLGLAKVRDWQQVQGAGFTPPPRHPTDVGLVVGTPGFYPPEAALVAADPRFDTFALGATIFLLCTGALPDLQDPRTMNDVRPEAGIPSELDALVASALAVVPDERIATAAEFQRRLAAILAAHTEDTEPLLFDGCYELIEVLGIGGKAEVHRAYHHDALRYVALKLLSEESCANPDERRRFVCEARALAAVAHPSLPTLIDCRTGMKRKRPFIAMSLARGRSAGDFMLPTTRLPPESVIAVGEQIGGALAALHAHGILHRDIHGSNVLVDLQENKVAATLIDVGMAGFTDRFYAKVEQRYPTPPGAREKPGKIGVETLDWTAPEIKAGHGWNEKCDVYSLAHLLYRILTGKRPFAGKEGALVSPREIRPDCPAALAGAISGGLERDPTLRLDLRGLLVGLQAAADAITEAADDDEADAETVSAPATRPAPGLVTTKTASAPATRPAPGFVAAATVSAPAACPAVEPAPPPPPVAPATPQQLDPPASVSLPSRVWPRMAATAVVVVTALGGAWWTSRSPTPSPDLATRPSTPAVSTDEPTPARIETPQAPAPLPAVGDALAAAAPDLRRCAVLAGGLLMLEFVVQEGSDRFAAVHVMNAPRNDVGPCIREATAAIVFAPTEPQIFAMEYTP